MLISPKCLQMGTWGKWTFGKKGSSSALISFPRNVYKWALGANKHLEKRGTPSVLCPFTPIFSNGHLGKMNIWKTAPSAHLLQCPFFSSTRLGKIGYPFPQLSICPKCSLASVPIYKILGGMGTRHLGIPLGYLGYSFPSNVHLLQMPIFFTTHSQKFGGIGHRAFVVPC